MSIALPCRRLSVPAFALAALLSALPLHGAETVYDVRSGVRVLTDSIADATTPTAVIKTGPGALKFNSPNTFSGGLALREGSVVNGAEWAFGTGQITLGEAGGTAAVTLDIGNFSNYTTVPNPIRLEPGVGRITIRQAGGFNNFLGGPITGQNNLSVATDGGANLTFAEQLDIAGDLLNVSGGPGIIQIKGGVGPAVRSIINTSASSSVKIFDKALVIGEGGKKLINESGAKGVVLLAASSGRGDLTLQNNGNLDGGINISGGGLLHEGDLVNSGTGNGAVTVRSVITGRVGNIIQDSMTSPLVLSGQNAHSGDTIVRKGRLVVAGAKAVPARSKISLQGGTIEFREAQEQVHTVELGAPSTLELAEAARVNFVVLSGDQWQGPLTITGGFTPGVSIRFGTSANALTSRQLAQITVAGHRDPKLNAQGYLVATPTTAPAAR
ncbi:MAG: hypothetical protein MUE42_03650 [Opitutaceae bacterium]|jgi:autotransporter-associated beta strand protein|nr:hypothetical protein [Opitutaceae bacterium]